MYFVFLDFAYVALTFVQGIRAVVLERDDRAVFISATYPREWLVRGSGDTVGDMGHDELVTKLKRPHMEAAHTTSSLCLGAQTELRHLPPNRVSTIKTTDHRFEVYFRCKGSVVACRPQIRCKLFCVWRTVPPSVLG